jgi:two-component system nitrogen regulation response regulator GlnG
MRTRSGASALMLMERRLLTAVLRHTGDISSQAAKVPGITRGSLRNKIRGLGISIGRSVSVEDELKIDSRRQIWLPASGPL